MKERDYPHGRLSRNINPDEILEAKFMFTVGYNSSMQKFCKS